MHAHRHIHRHLPLSPPLSSPITFSIFTFISTASSPSQLSDFLQSLFLHFAYFNLV
ncbi:hypothetical protein PHMEG_00025295 [Phytophthora megakarya]|uniref:Uncharacterized protein n=1 Tax=Phytophthora megakarya TaxID=4795 RepID=A0A225VCD2_9STRA|nr:hypothetical protein PHMEG_00025295 [Phytophthora megakarya]